MIRQLCIEKNISISELARRIGQTPQNFGKKLKRETITLDELQLIANVLNVRYEQAFVLQNGERIRA
jgi:transcriptional regulator with XRE-family HTH domain